MKYRPLRDQVLIQRQKAEQTTTGGLIIPEAHQTKSRRGKVLAVGPGRFKKGSTDRIPVDLKPGDVVLFQGHSSVRGEVSKGDGLLMIQESDVHAVIS